MVQLHISTCQNKYIPVLNLMGIKHVLQFFRTAPEHFLSNTSRLPQSLVCVCLCVCVCVCVCVRAPVLLKTHCVIQHDNNLIHLCVHPSYCIIQSSSFTYLSSCKSVFPWLLKAVKGRQKQKWFLIFLALHFVSQAEKRLSKPSVDGSLQDKLQTLFKYHFHQYLQVGK